MTEFKKILNENKIATVIFLLITIIYFFPAFLGKVDTAVDIRDGRMYPWKYYAVDKKIKKLVLWENTSSLFSLSAPLKSTNKATFKINLDKNTLKKAGKLNDSNYYIELDFSSGSVKEVAYDFGILLTDKLNGVSFKPRVAIAPLKDTNKEIKGAWHRAQFNLDELINEFEEPQNLNNYNLDIVMKNNSNTNSSVMYISELKLICEDFSDVVRVHNYYNDDLIRSFTPAREYYSKSLKKLKLPFWNNYLLTGSEFIAEPQVGYFHPLYLISYLFFDHFTAHEIVTFICFFLCGIGAFLLARYWGLSFSASLFTGLVYMFQPFNVTWFSYGHMLLNSATLPFLLLFYEKSLSENKIINKHLLASAFLFGLIFLSGHLQYVQYSIIFFTLFIFYKFLYLTFSKKINYSKFIFGILFIFVVSIMIGGIVLVPFIPVLQNGYRLSNSESYVRSTSVPLKAFLGLIYPFYQGIPDWPLSGLPNRSLDYETYKLGFFRNYVYLGIVPFLFSLFSIKSIFKNKLTLFFYLTIIFSLLICMGTPLFNFVKEIIPGFREMQHHRFLMLYSLCIPFVSGIGLQTLIDHFSALKNKLKIFLFIIVFMFSFIDLFYYSSYFLTWSDRSSYKPLHKGGALQFIKSKQRELKEPFRVLPFSSYLVKGTVLKSDVAVPNTLLPYEIEDVSGYSSFIPKDFFYTLFYVQDKDTKKLYGKEVFDLFENNNSPYPISNFHSKILDLLNVRYFIVPNFLTIDSEKVQKVFSGDCTVYENKNCLPRAFIAPKYRVIGSPKETIVALDSEKFNAQEEIILMSDPHVIARRLKEPTKQSQECKTVDENDTNSFKYNIDFVKYEPDNITLKVKTNQSGFLVLGHNLNNNWKVKVNQRESRCLQANLVQRAVYLPKAGKYLIEFYYFPVLFLKGLLISLFSFLVLIVLGIYLQIRKR